MTDVIGGVFSQAKFVIPVLIVLLFNALVNLERKERSYQIFMPIVTLAYVYVLYFSSTSIGELINSLIRKITSGQEVKGYFLFTIVNIVSILIYFAWKRAVIRLFKSIFSKGNPIHDRIAEKFYEHNAEDNIWYLKENMVQARRFLKIIYYAILIVSCLIAMVVCYAVKSGLMDDLFYPIIPVLIFGEVYAFFNGLSKSEDSMQVAAENSKSERRANYALLRPVLSQMFGDKLIAEDTTINNSSFSAEVNDHSIQAIINDEDTVIEAYGTYMKNKLKHGIELKQDYMYAGLELLRGKSLLFNNPFYYDLIPYVFFVMNHILLRHKKVLIILGRHGIEEDVKNWCEKGISEVTGNPYIWEIDMLSDNRSNADIGILKRSEVCNRELYEKNCDFLADTEFVFIIEPSKLITTAQIGLNCIVRYCKSKVTFCSTDKNCDGLIDALSHVLQTSISEVAATDHHLGTSSYMCWSADGEKLQHRMLPGISRYLGFGTELSFAAMKNQVANTYWYGGEAFPVTDMHWIAKQYYYPLLKYADLPQTQEYMERCMITSPNLWNAQSRKYHYMTVEDESNNLFEARRLFASRASKQGFVNIISTNYLLREYMAANEKIFDADSKAIPYIVADYDRTKRNTLMRILLGMSGKGILESELKRELVLMGVNTQCPFEAFWDLLCECFASNVYLSYNDKEMTIGSKEIKFTTSVFKRRRKFLKDNEKLNVVYYLDDDRFTRAILGDLQNVAIIAEDERGTQNYLGTEVKGQIFQKHLPGQYFVFNGKYYEMVKVTSDDQMIVRRAADHITSREEYRQVRDYSLNNISYSQEMGDAISISGVKMQIGYADISVQTKSFWRMSDYNNFEDAEEVILENVPSREYAKKHFLKLDFAENKNYDPGVVKTLTILLNEVFKTIFAENQCYIAAVSQSEIAIPDLYSIQIENEATGTAIYIIEDSQLDIGLLTAFKRNIKRIFSIICEYLEWQKEYYNAIEAEEYSFESDDIEEPQAMDGSSKKGIDTDETEEFYEDEDSEEDLAEDAEDDIEADNEPESEDDIAEIDAVEEALEEDEEVEDMLHDEDTDADLGEGDDVMSEDDSNEDDIFASVGNGSKKHSPRIPYLNYGGDELPPQMLIDETIEFLKALKYSNSELKQARRGTSLSINKYMDIKSGHSCDFCGRIISGVDFDILSDGRERCMVCSRNAVKDEAEFIKIFVEVRENLRLHFGISFNGNVTVSMVNAIAVNKKANRGFVPTAQPDSRIIGIAEKNKDGFAILLENGAPRMQTMLTLAHELTHIWQYQNWDNTQIATQYGEEKTEVYEGMAAWVEVQYAYLINESIVARRKNDELLARDDVYGKGFRRYSQKYPISEDTMLQGMTPFMDKNNPL